MTIVEEALKEATNARIETTEFGITTFELLNKKLQTFVNEAGDEEKEKVQEILTQHIATVERKKAENQMLKLINSIFDE